MERKFWKKIIVAAMVAGGIGFSGTQVWAATGAELLASGDTAYQANDYQQAWNSYNEALKLDEALAAAYNGRGRVLCRQGKNQEALAEFARALELEPENGIFYACRSQAYRNMGNYEQELADLRRAADYSPAELALYVNMIRALTELGRLDECVAPADKVVKLYQEKNYTTVLLQNLDNEIMSQLLMSAASVYANYSGHDSEKAVAVSELALKEYEANVFAYMLRAAAYDKLGKYQAGLDDCARGIELATQLQLPDAVTMLHLLQAGIYYDMKDYPTALHYTDLVRQARENWKDNYSMRYSIFKDMGDRKNAEAAAKRFAELGGDAKELVR